MHKIKLFQQIFVVCLMILYIDGLKASGTKKAGNDTTIFYKVRIEPDTSFNPDLIGVPALWPGKNANPHFDFDSINHSLSMIWDSVPAGSCTFSLTGAFGMQQTFSFILSSDTTITISDQLGIKSVPVIDEKELENADTIQVMYGSSGCFHSYEETAKIIKNKNGTYFLHFNGRDTHYRLAVWDKTVSARFIKNIYRLEKSAIETGKRTAGTKLFSTTTQSLYIMVNKRLFRYTDHTGQWKTYPNFRKQCIKG